jgi:hypothetical protein
MSIDDHISLQPSLGQGNDAVISTNIYHQAVVPIGDGWRVALVRTVKSLAASACAR